MKTPIMGQGRRATRSTVHADGPECEQAGRDPGDAGLLHRAAPGLNPGRYAQACARVLNATEGIGPTGTSISTGSLHLNTSSSVALSSAGDFARRASSP